MRISKMGRLKGNRGKGSEAQDAGSTYAEIRCQGAKAQTAHSLSAYIVRELQAARRKLNRFKSIWSEGYLSFYECI